MLVHKRPSQDKKWTRGCGQRTYTQVTVSNLNAHWAKWGGLSAYNYKTFFKRYPPIIIPVPAEAWAGVCERLPGIRVGFPSFHYEAIS